jgi:hypothetical protein
MITSDHEEKRAEAQVTLFTAHSDTAKFHNSSAVLNYSNNSAFFGKVILFSNCAIGFYDWKFSVPNLVRGDPGGPVGRRPLSCLDCGFESSRVHGCLSVVNVVCCQVEESASD